MKLYFLLAAIVSLAFLTSCREPSMDDWTIHVGIQNSGTNTINKASVSWGEFWFRAGLVAPSSEAVHVGFDRPIPETATVYYSLPDDRKVEKTVTVKTAIPKVAYKDKDKDITFMFDVNSNANEVTVKILHYVRKEGYPQLVPYD